MFGFFAFENRFFCGTVQRNPADVIFIILRIGSIAAGLQPHALVVPVAVLNECGIDAGILDVLQFLEHFDLSGGNVLTCQKSVVRELLISAKIHTSVVCTGKKVNNAI